MSHRKQTAAAALATVEARSGREAELEDVDIPEHEYPIDIGRAVAIIYEDPEGQEWTHEFERPGRILISAGILSIIEPGLCATDLGIEE